jgi:UrcA family protein
MNIRAHRIAAALAALPILALASGAFAEGVHIQYGDLSRPEQAAAFSQRIDIAAKQICSSIGFSAGQQRQISDCKAEVREEAMAQLNRAQREQMAAYANGVQLARR